MNKRAPLHSTTLKNIEDRKRKERELMRTPTPEEIEYDEEGHPRLKLLNYDTLTTTESTVITSSLVKDIIKLSKSFEFEGSVLTLFAWNFEAVTKL